MAKKNRPVEDCMIHQDEPCTCVSTKRVKGLYSEKVNRPDRPTPKGAEDDGTA